MASVGTARWRRFGRSRRGAAALLAVAVTAGVVIAVALRGSAGVADRSGSGGSRTARTAVAAGDLLGGKAEDDTIGIESANSWLVGVNASAEGSGRQQFWTARTDDGGRTWRTDRPTAGTSSPDAGTFTFVNPRDGWSEAGSLYFTRDGGRRWQRSPGGRGIAGLAVHGASTWLLVERCPTASTCSILVDDARTPGAVPQRQGAPIRVGTEQSVQAFLRPSGATAWLETDDRTGRPSLFVTTDSGRTWSKRALPCGLRASAGAIGGASPGALWATCTEPLGSEPASDPVAVYRSANSGRTWTRATPAGGQTELTGVARLDVVARRVAWAVDDDRSGTGTVERTTDGGRTWTPVLANPPTAVDFVVTTLAATGRDDAWVAAWEPRPQGRSSEGRVMVVFVTRDGGRHWRATHPAAPPEIRR